MHSSDFPFKERPETVAFIWPKELNAANYEPIEPCFIDVSYDQPSFQLVQAAIGWHVTDEQWNQLLSELVPNSMVFVRCGDDPVGVACALVRDSGWAELAWVAVSPVYRGHGIGKVVCSAVVSQLLRSGWLKIFGSTQDDRLAALKIYLDLGFCPVIRPEKLERWRLIYQKLEKPFNPHA